MSTLTEVTAKLEDVGSIQPLREQQSTLGERRSIRMGETRQGMRMRALGQVEEGSGWAMGGRQENERLGRSCARDDETWFPLRVSQPGGER